MNRKLQVFVSSTFLDMRDERQAAVEAILEAGHIPAGMELFAASDQSQWETITNWIDDSDVYMLILGGRYGSIEPESGKSYIEKEYLYALEAGKPLFALVIASDALDAKMVANPRLEVKESVNPHLLRAFRDETVKKRLCHEFIDLNHLKAGFFRAIRRYDRDDKLSGWVKGSEVVNPKSLIDENSRLRETIANFEQELNSLRHQVTTLGGINTSQEERSREEVVADSLSPDCAYLLVKLLIEDSVLQHGVGTYLIVADEVYKFENMRAEARWRDVIRALNNLGLIERTRSGHDEYLLSYWGYNVADVLLKREKNQANINNPPAFVPI